MATKEKDVKLLWGRSGNRCAICRTRVSQDATVGKGAYPLGEQAHIVGAKDDSPRGTSLLTPEQRDSYHNLILLCPTHHTEIDKAIADWPVDKLHQAKSEHELWVEETLGEKIDKWKLAEDLVVTTLVDSAVDLCDLEHWSAWTSFALSPEPSWRAAYPERIEIFGERVLAVPWPAERYDELHRAARTFSVLLHRAALRFLDHSEQRHEGGPLRPIKFYKLQSPNPNYKPDLERYKQWISECHYLIREATKAANWFADVVRRDVNPMFFATQGRFLVQEGPFADLSYRTALLQFTAEELAMLPDALHESPEANAE